MQKVAKIVTIVVGSFVVLIAATAYVGYRALKVLVPTGAIPTMPADFEKAGVTNGAVKFEKSTFYSNTNLGTITEMRRDATSLVIVGTHSAIFLNADKSVRRKVSFSPNMQYGPVTLVGSAKGEQPLFLGHGSWSWPMMLVDSAGRELWRYGGTPGVDDAAAGDLAGDGKIEIAVGMNGSGGILLFDENGNRIWSKSDGNVWQVEIVEGASGVPGYILHSNAQGDLITRDIQGSVLEQRRLDMYLSHFSLTRWNREPNPTHVVASDTDAVYLYAEHGQRAARFKGSAPVFYNDIQALSVPYSDGSTYFAVVRRYGRWDRSLLTINAIHGDHGELIYREVLQDSCHGMATAPSGNGQALLLGCRDAVYEYDLPHSTTN